jgi:hypothetical protein
MRHGREMHRGMSRIEERMRWRKGRIEDANS